MRCKQHRACETNKYFNFYRKKHEFDLEAGYPRFDKKDQCRPKVEQDESVCRQCCDRDLVTWEADPYCGLEFMKRPELDVTKNIFNRLWWGTDQTNAVLPPPAIDAGWSGKDRKKMFKLVNEKREAGYFNDATDWVDPNDSRYPNKDGVTILI
jgi:hypothetical protein